MTARLPRKSPAVRVLRRRRGWVPAAVAAATLLASGCSTRIVGDDGARPTVLVVSDVWVSGQQGGTATGAAAAGSAAPGRLRDLERVVSDLRAETGTGWVGRQDDVTGYLTELSGGSWPGGPQDFIDTYGSRLFAVDSTALRLAEPDSRTVPGITTTKAGQVVADVPVLDASLTFSVRDGRLSEVRGRVFPGLRVDTVPVVTVEQAGARAAERAGGSSVGEPRLVVLPTGVGTLAWEVAVVATAATGSPAPGLYYVDATTGDVVDVRPLSADVAPPVPGASTLRVRRVSDHAPPRSASVVARPLRAPASDARPVAISGADALGRPLRGSGLRTDRGIVLVDTTTSAYDPASGRGAVRTYDASAAADESELPGELARTRKPTVNDSDTMAAHAYSRDVMDYWSSMGRDSWDGAGGDLVSSVHLGRPDFCNAFFIDYLTQPQMVYGNACVVDGEAQSASLVAPDIAGHEITHGVTATTAGLLYSGQSGALNESFSDYFGNVIGDLVAGRDSAAIAEDSCTGLTAPTAFCQRNPDGTSSLRYMLNGTDFDDYLRVLDPGSRLNLLLGYTQDYGGVHLNSAIWNNALWTIRTRLAQIDGQPGTTSPLARAFDRAVYGALATRLTPTSGFTEARKAIEQVIVDSSLDPTVLRVAREVFDADKICAGCPDTTGVAGESISSAPQTQLHPRVSGSRVAWLDLSGSGQSSGYAATTTLRGAAPSLSADGTAVDVAFAGDALVTLGNAGEVTRVAPDGTTTRLDTVGSLDTQAAGLGGSDQGAAWLSDATTLAYVDAAGRTTSARVTGLAGDTITAVASGGGTVAAGTDQGRVYVWTPGGPVAEIARVDGAVIDVATYAGAVFVITDQITSTLVTAQGEVLPVTDHAVPFGATMSEEYVVWAEATGPVDVGVAPAASSGFPETDLYLLSLATGEIVDLLPSPAQQGFPSPSGRALVWQDAALGGDDVFTMTLPGGM